METKIFAALPRWWLPHTQTLFWNSHTYQPGKHTGTLQLHVAKAHSFQAFNA
jgi:hypothetical protein